MVRRGRSRAASSLLLVAAMLFLSVSAFAGFQAVRPARAAQTWDVTVGDDFYSPATITINVGDTVTWNNQGSMTHTVTSDPNQTVYFNSGDLGPDNSYSFTFTVAGNFTYACQYHDMAGRVIVVQPAPEFPGYVVLAVLAAGVGAGLLIERRMRE